MEKLDILNREEFIDQLVNVTEHISANRGNVSFAINGVWGCGKSFVLDMYEEKLSQIQSEETASEKYFIIRYNCWKYDYYEEPLIAIVSTLISAIEEKTKFFKDSEEKAKFLGTLKAVGISFLSLANSTIKEKIGLDLETAYDIVQNGIAEGQAAFNREQAYNVYFNLNKAIETLQKLLNGLSGEYTIVLLVDELDRCLPEYAIKVLERLHHITENVENIITVISIDKEQLASNIQSIFGEENNTNRYLKKFIQFKLDLKIGTVSSKFMEKYVEYVNMFDKTKMPFNDSVEEFIQVIFQNIDARMQEHIVERTTLIHKMLFSETKDYSFMCIELLMVVLYSCYNNIKKFSSWLNPYSNLFEDSRTHIPFDAFFNSKFQKSRLTVDSLHSEGNYVTRILESASSLYGIIAYVWYQVELSPNNGGDCYIGISNRMNPAQRDMLLDNVEELKKFSSMLKLIK